MIDYKQLITLITSNLYDIIYRLLLILFLWIFIFLFAKKFDRFVSKRFNKWLKSFGIGKRRIKLVDNILDIAANILGIIITLYLLNLTSVIYTVLTAAGVIGIIVGFAVKEIAQNYISGLIIKFTQPFIKGDSVKVNNDIKGIIEEITPFNTEILDYDGILTIVPNSFLMNKAVTNYSREPNRRISINVSISKDNNVDKTLKVLEKIGKNENKRIKDRGVDVFVHTIQDYKIDLTLRFWTPKPLFWSVKRNTLKKIAKEFKKNKIELAVPLRKNINMK